MISILSLNTRQLTHHNNLVKFLQKTLKHSLPSAKLRFL